MTWRWNWQAAVTARSSRAIFAVAVVIIGANWWDCMSRNLLVSIIARPERALHFMNMRRMELRIGGLTFGASDLELDF